jgi:hypothetical protein
LAQSGEKVENGVRDGVREEALQMLEIRDMEGRDRHFQQFCEVIRHKKNLLVPSKL